MTNRKHRDTNPVSGAARSGLAISIGSINLLGESLRQPGRYFAGLERRGERVLDRLEKSNAAVRRSLGLLGRRTSATVSTAGTSVGATLGVVSPARSSRPRASVRTVGGATTTRKKRSEAGVKAARTRKLNEAKGAAERRVSAARSRTTRAAKEGKGGVEKTVGRVQQGMERMGDRIERGIESLAS
ncbi:MAG: hypothetical protein ACYDGR_03510 [Candidatus Dormibacteria bacterium]